MRTFVRLGVVLVAGLVSPPARADDQVLDPVVVRNRLYRVAGRPELLVSLGFMPVTRLTDHWTLSATAGFNLHDTLAVEGRGTVAYSRQTGLARQVARQFLQRDPALGIGLADDLSDLWEMRGNLVAGVRWSPIYGKLSLLAELPLHFQAYLAAGGGLGSFHRTSLVYCRALISRDEGTCGEWLSQDRLSPLGTAAVGIRFFLHPGGSLRVEARDYAFQDAYLVNIDRLQAEAGGQTGEPGPAGLTHLVLFDVGYAFMF
jgi:outer membrane beta-barrel protein